MPKKTQNKVPETIVVGDTSALISLGVGGVLSKCLENSITITEAQDTLNRISEGRTWESAAIYNLAKKYIEKLKEQDRK